MERSDRPAGTSAPAPADADASEDADQDPPARASLPASGEAAGDRRAVDVAVAVAEAAGPVSVDALATMLAAREHGRSPDRLRAAHRRRARLALVRDHLPALVARDAVRRAEDGGYVPGPSIGSLIGAGEADPSPFG